MIPMVWGWLAIFPKMSSMLSTSVQRPSSLMAVQTAFRRSSRNFAEAAEEIQFGSTTSDTRALRTPPVAGPQSSIGRSGNDDAMSRQFR